MVVIKKDGSEVLFDDNKIVSAILKSAARVNLELTEESIDKVIQLVKSSITGDKTSVSEIHTFVEIALDEVEPSVAKSYRDYRNYKKDFVRMMDDVYTESQQLKYLGDKENANTDSSLIATRRSLIFKKLNKEFYKKFFLTSEENNAINEGYIYVHDLGDRADFSINCCLFDLGNVLKDGFELAGIRYTEPKTLKTAFSCSSDIILAASSQQYGGFTIPEIDKILAPYAEKSYQKYYNQIVEETTRLGINVQTLDTSKISKLATEKVERDFEQGVQGLEMKLNTIGSSRGDFPFTTVTFGLGTNKWEKIASKTFLSVRKNGQGEDGKKVPVLFPKLIFLYDKELHSETKINHDVFVEAIDCSSKCMYPDYLSLTGKGYVSEIYKKYGTPISQMGCRATLSPWYAKGGIKPINDTDYPIYVGRFNIGAISLNLPMILAKANEENKEFYSLLNYYLDMIRKIHQKTYKYTSKQKASTNPLGFTQGGFLYGDLDGADTIEKCVKNATTSFAYTALNELQYLYNGKTLFEDGDFAYDVLKHINEYVDNAKAEDGYLYAVYGTPAESLCGTQLQQFRKKYGIIPGVSDKEYFSNSFHMAVWEDITPIEKQNAEERFYHLSKGGCIQYCRYPNSDNIEAITQLIERAMEKGYYEGVNLEKNYCNNCGHQFFENDNKCPKCLSNEITQINRICGYLGFSKINGDTRMNVAKLEEIKDRKSM